VLPAHPASQNLPHFIKSSSDKVLKKPAPQDTLPPCPAKDDEQPTSTEIRRVGARVSAPKIIRYVNASFSKEARKEKIQGKSIIQLVVGTDGLPTRLCLAKPLGYGLDEQAALAVRQYRFAPAMAEGGGPVPVQISIEVNFRLY